MQKNYVLDTNVLLHDPDALHGFDDNNVNIPITVIEEIDRFKNNLDEIGRYRARSGKVEPLRLPKEPGSGRGPCGSGCLRRADRQTGSRTSPQPPRFHPARPGSRGGSPQ